MQRSPSYEAAGSVDRSILIGINGRPDDGGWCEAAYRALSRVDALCGRVKVVERFPETIDGEWSAVIGHGMTFAGPLLKAAKANPDIPFILTDDLDHDETPPPNLTRVDWRWDEGSFLAGVLASRLSKTGTVGFLGGDPCRTQHLAMTAFVRGARDARRDAVVLTALAGSFDNPARGFHLANAFFDEGVDVLLHTADSTGRGAIRAAEVRGRRMIGFLNRDDAEHDCVAATIETDVEGVMTLLLEGLASGRAVSGVVACGLGSGHQRFKIADSVADSVRRHLQGLVSLIADKQLRVRAPSANA